METKDFVLGFAAGKSSGVKSVYAFIDATYPAGVICTATKGGIVITAPDTSGHFVFTIPEAGTWVISADGIEETVVISSYGQSETVELKYITIVPWSTGTDAQIAAMVAALDNGDISITETGWQIGDERIVRLAAMEATGVGETHAEQDVTLVLMDSQHYDFVGGGKDHFVVGLKHLLNEEGYMNSSSTNNGSWNGCARRSWCNNVFRAAIPEVLRACFKQFQCVTAESYNGSTNKISNDYFSLFAEQEIFGSRTYSNTTEAAALTQIEWYKTPTNRIKRRSGSAAEWWDRSPSGSYNSFCTVYSNGETSTGDAKVARGLAPFGCI